MGFLYSFAFVLVFAAVVSSESYTPTNRLEEQILSLLNKWRKGAVETNLFPLPSLKTINIGQIDSSYDERGIKITFSIEDLKLIGLNNFTVENLKVTPTLDDVNIFMKLAVPVLTLSSDNYKLKGRAYLIYPLQGAGKLTVKLRNVIVSLKVHFDSTDGNSTRISDFVLKYTIGKVEANLENSSWPINQVLNREGVDIIDNYHDDIVYAIWNYAVPYANKYLVNISPTDFLNIIAEMGMNSYLVPEKS